MSVKVYNSGTSQWEGGDPLGGAAFLDVGTTAGTVAAGDDARLSDDRDPTAHASSHASAGGDAITPGDIGAAPAASGVTNGDSHDHSGGDGGQIAYSSLSGTPTLGTAAATASTDYATAAQGSTADTALQPGDAISIADINLDGGTDIGADLADADLILVDDGAGGTNRKSALSRVWTYITAKITAGIRPLFLSYKETVYAITDDAGFAIDPTNGSVQTITLGASRTPVAANFDAGHSLTLMVNDGSSYAITWTSVPVTWVGGSAPTLATSGYTVINLWKVGSTIYGMYTGSVA